MSKVAAERKGNLFLVFAISMSIVVYGLVIVLLTSGGRSEDLPDRMGSVRPVLWLLALALLAIAAWVVPRVAQGAAPESLLPGQVFRGRIFMAMLLCEGAAVLGLVLAFLSRRPGDFAIPAGAALLLVGAHVVPTTLRYYAERERLEKG